MSAFVFKNENIALEGANGSHNFLIAFLSKDFIYLAPYSV